MYNFTGFSEKANMALNKAMECAEDLGHTYIGSEHILLGLCDATDSVAGKLLNSKGVTYRKIFDTISRTVGAGMPTELNPADFTPRSKHIIESALSLANSLKQTLAGTEHLLLSICREGNGYGCQLLSISGVSPQSLINDLASSMSGKNTQSKPFGQQNKNNNSVLDKFSRDLTSLARENRPCNRP